METKEPLPNPLPTRFKEVKAFRDAMQRGVVVLPEHLVEHYDAANAAQSIIIDHLLTEVMVTWQTPTLECASGDFYKCFSLTYFHLSREQEEVIWQTMLDSTLASSDLVLDNLQPLEAATLTLANFPGYHEVAASSQEIFLETSLHAAVYEQLLQEKYKEAYIEHFYHGLKENFSLFLKRLIALDSVIIDLYRANITVHKPADGSEGAEYGPLNSQCFQLGEHDELRMNPLVLSVLKEYALKNNLKKDTLGREANRGCPFLVSKVQDEFIDFVIGEFISQHQKYFK